MAILLLTLATSAHAQLQVGDNTTLKLDALAGVGWTGTYDGEDQSNLTYGFSGNLTGDYYDPRFLNWTVSPYLNQSRLNSNFNSTSSASGVNAQANFLNNSRTPISFSYALDHNAEGTFNVPGSIGSYQTVGNGQNIGVNAAYFPEDWPSIQGSFAHSGSSYEVIGSPGSGEAHANSLGFNSTYSLWDTMLSAAYSKSYSDTENPLLGTNGSNIKTSNNQDTFQFSATRQLAEWSQGSFNFGRSHLNADYSGFQTDATYDTMSGFLSARATQRLTFNLHANYSSNLSAQTLSSILNGTPVGPKAAVSGADTNALSYTSDYLNYGVTSSYNITHELTATGSVYRQVQGQPEASDSTSTVMETGITWSHQVLGGSLGAHYGIAHYYAPLVTTTNGQTTATESTFTGQTAAASYARRFLGFSGSGSFSYGHSLTSLLVGYLQSSYLANGSISRELFHWNVSGSVSFSRAQVEGISISDSRSTAYSFSLAHSNLGLSANYGRSNGSGLQVGNSIIPTPVPGPIPQYLILFGGESYGAGVSYRAFRRWTTSGSYTKLKYDTTNLGGANSMNTSEQLFFRTEYHFRQLSFNAGFSHLRQGFGIGAVQPATLDTVYFGVSRRFDIF
jgi:hypothetical protein